MEDDRPHTPDSMLSSTNADHPTEEQRRHFTEDDIDQVLDMAEQLDRVPVMPRGPAAAHASPWYAHKLVALIIVFVGILVFHYARSRVVERPAASPYAERIKERQHAAPNKTAEMFSDSLKDLQDSFMCWEICFQLADMVEQAANDGAMSRTNAPRDALEGLAFAPTVLQHAHRDQKDALLVGRLVGTLLTDTLFMVKIEAERVPRDAKAAVVHFNQTLDKVQLKLDTVLQLIQSMVSNLGMASNRLVLLVQALTEVIAALEDRNKDAKTFGCASAYLLIPDFISDVARRKVQGEDELAWADELRRKLMTGPATPMADPFDQYAQGLRLRVVDKLRSQDVSGAGGSWANTLVLETWTHHGHPDKVAPQVLRNFETMLTLLEETQTA